MDKRVLAENLYKLIETPEDDILRVKCHSGRDHEIAPAIYQLLQADKVAPMYALACCMMASGCPRNLYARRKYLEEAIEFVPRPRNKKAARDKKGQKSGGRGPVEGQN